MRKLAPTVGNERTRGGNACVCVCTETQHTRLAGLHTLLTSAYPRIQPGTGDYLATDRLNYIAVFKESGRDTQ